MTTLLLSMKSLLKYILNMLVKLSMIMELVHYSIASILMVKTYVVYLVRYVSQVLASMMSGMRRGWRQPQRLLTIKDGSNRTTNG